MDRQIVAWASVTAACLELRRAGLRGEHPGESKDQIETRLQQEQRRARARRTDAYRRNA